MQDGGVELKSKLRLLNGNIGENYQDFIESPTSIKKSKFGLGLGYHNQSPFLEQVIEQDMKVKNQEKEKFE